MEWILALVVAAGFLGALFAVRSRDRYPPLSLRNRPDSIAGALLYAESAIEATSDIIRKRRSNPELAASYRAAFDQAMTELFPIGARPQLNDEVRPFQTLVKTLPDSRLLAAIKVSLENAKAVGDETTTAIWSMVVYALTAEMALRVCRSHDLVVYRRAEELLRRSVSELSSSPTQIMPA